MFKNLFLVLIIFGIIAIQTALNTSLSYAEQEVDRYEQLKEYAQNRGWNE